MIVFHFLMKFLELKTSQLAIVASNCDGLIVSFVVLTTLIINALYFVLIPFV